MPSPDVPHRTKRLGRGVGPCRHVAGGWHLRAPSRPRPRHRRAGKRREGAGWHCAARAFARPSPDGRATPPRRGHGGEPRPSARCGDDRIGPRAPIASPAACSPAALSAKSPGQLATPTDVTVRPRASSPRTAKEAGDIVIIVTRGYEIGVGGGARCELLGEFQWVCPRRQEALAVPRDAQSHQREVVTSTLLVTAIRDFITTQNATQMTTSRVSSRRIYTANRAVPRRLSQQIPDRELPSTSTTSFQNWSTSAALQGSCAATADDDGLRCSSTDVPCQGAL